MQVQEFRLGSAQATVFVGDGSDFADSESAQVVKALRSRD
jgi:hypothetical protein